MKKELTMLPDSELITLFRQKNNNDAFDVLTSRHYKNVHVYLLRRLNYNGTYASDLTQEVFIKTMQSMRNGKYNENYKFANWLICVAKNTFIDYIRKRNMNIFLQKTYTKELFGGLDNLFEQYQDNRLMKEETKKQLLLLLDQLSIEQRETLVLRFFGNYKYKEIANIINSNISINTYLGRSRYGIKNLKDMIEKITFFA